MMKFSSTKVTQKIIDHFEVNTVLSIISTSQIQFFEAFIFIDQCVQRTKMFIIQNRWNTLLVLLTLPALLTS